MTTTETKTTAAIEIEAQELHRILTNAVIFTASDNMALDCIRVELASSGNLGIVTTTATNRYAAIREQYSLAEASGRIDAPTTFYVHAHDAKQLAKVAKDHKRGRVILTFDGETLMLTAGATSTAVSVTTDVGYPAVDAFFDDFTAADLGADGIKFFADRLAELVKVRPSTDKRDPIVHRFMFQAAQKAALVKVGPNIDVIVMPSR